ncbi:unnamed protein product, partial [Brachionus calyciflorus]
QGIFSNGVHPGEIITDLQRHMSDEDKLKFDLIDKDGNVNPRFKSVEQGASTSIWAAVSEELEGKGGMYFEDCGYSELRQNFEEALKTRNGHLSYLIDEQKALELWNLSLELVKNL